MTKIALCLIVKGTEEESQLLDRCLDNMSPYVDGIFITSTYKKGGEKCKEIDTVCKKYKAHVSYYEWENDFSKARNFNFSQVPKEYDYIMWSDSDDMWRGLDKLRETVEKHKADAFGFWYLYQFDEHKQPIVCHKKTMIVKNDKCVEWAGALHEDFKENRQLSTVFIEGIERMHFTNEERIEESKKRNIEVSLKDYQENGNDPRTAWNYANSLLGDGKTIEAQKVFEDFIERSSSEEEIYLARLRMAEIEHAQGNKDLAIRNYQLAIGMRPDYSDAYLQLGYLLSAYLMWDKAEYYLLNGLVKKPPYDSIIVYNPRDYDYNPMMALAKVYFNKSRPDLALPMLKGCVKINPNSEYLNTLVAEMEREVENLGKALEFVKKYAEEKNKDVLKKEIEKLDVQTRSHPAVCALWNTNFPVTETSGKDIAYYCGNTTHEWNPIMAKTKGIGGSEEAVINLSKEWAKMGYNVTVYNNCGTEPMEVDGVKYKPFWYFNAKDKFDTLIIWRHPKLVDYELNAKNVFIDLHDVVSDGEFNEKRLEKITKVFVKTKAHRELLPSIPDKKICIVPNGQDFELFNQDIKKDQYLIVNTSSPDRSMDVLPELFKRVKERVPQAKCKWAYGFDIFDNAHGNNKEMMEWRNKTIKAMEEAGVENMGRLSQAECAKLYLEANILAYPTEFMEIDCITVKKAQACGCMPITTDFGALNESVQYGVKIHSKLTKDTWGKYPTHGIRDKETQDLWVDAVVKQLQTPIEDRTEMKNWARKFAWDKIATQWIKTI